MDIQHRITFGHKDLVDKALEKMGLKCERSQLPGNGYLTHLTISESHSYWPEVLALVQEKKAVDIFDTTFTDPEVREAEWCRLSAIYENGYPQPEKGRGWAKIVYENQCPKCGIGFRQKAPFHLKQEPSLNGNDFITVYWAHVVFTTPRVFRIFEEQKISGYEKWEVIIDQSKEPSRGAHQLFVTEIAKPGLSEPDKRMVEVCSDCGLTKYGFHARGYLHFKKAALKSNVDIQLTSEWFGSGGYSGYQEILISKRLANLILDHKWRGVMIKPIILE